VEHPTGKSTTTDIVRDPDGLEETFIRTHQGDPSQVLIYNHQGVPSQRTYQNRVLEFAGPFPLPPVSRQEASVITVDPDFPGPGVGESDPTIGQADGSLDFKELIEGVPLKGTDGKCGFRVHQPPTSIGADASRVLDDGDSGRVPHLDGRA
jgi:hypothetical protein